MKKCSVCQKTKELICFTTAPSRKDGYHHRCRECESAYKKTPKMQAAIKVYKEKNRDKYREYARDGMRRLRKKDPEKLNKYVQDWRKKNPDRWKEIYTRSRLKRKSLKL